MKVIFENFHTQYVTAFSQFEQTANKTFILLSLLCKQQKLIPFLQPNLWTSHTLSKYN